MYDVPSGFEWDPTKADENVRRHGVAFTEAATAFDDPDALVAGDDWHSAGEDRFLVVGRSARGRVVTVSYTMRGDVTRIISARRAEPEERRDYERHAGA